MEYKWLCTLKHSIQRHVEFGALNIVLVELIPLVP